MQHCTVQYVYCATQFNLITLNVIQRVAELSNILFLSGNIFDMYQLNCSLACSECLVQLTYSRNGQYTLTLFTQVQQLQTLKGHSAESVPIPCCLLFKITLYSLSFFSIVSNNTCYYYSTCVMINLRPFLKLFTLFLNDKY